MLPAQQRASDAWVEKEEAETDWEYGERPEQRSMEQKLGNGLVLVDKPNGPTSNQVSLWVKDLLERDKTGHSGTLDPHVTGVLPVGLDRATKVLGPLSSADKEYVCRMELSEKKARSTIEAAAEDLRGVITQVPPEKSAVKREERERRIHSLQILEVEDRDVLFRVGCEKGFYVRTFCEQFGEMLGVEGTMAELRRTRVGVFHEEDTVTLHDLVDQYQFWQEGKDNTLDDIVLPVEAGIRHLHKIVVKDSAVAALTHGADLGATGIATLQENIEEGEAVALLTLKGELIATATALTSTQAILDSEETVAELDRVYMQNDVYPREW